VPKAWLAKYSWEAVTAINAQLCETKGALHKEGLTVMDRHFLEAVSAHIVAVTETPEEAQQFRALLQKVDC
jgi:hypothetical protein